MFCDPEAVLRDRDQGGRVGEGIDTSAEFSSLSTDLVDYWQSYALVRPKSTPAERSHLLNHAEHVQLIETGIQRNSGGVWADFGAGGGAFTLALRDIAGPDVDLIAIDRDPASLHTLRSTMERQYPGTRLRLLEADVAGHLSLPPLDGIVVANAIHYIPNRKHAMLLQRWKNYLQPNGRLIAVEYDADTGNRWVPYPVSYTALKELAGAAGYTEPVLLGVRPSQWLAQMYAALIFPTMTTAAAQVSPRGT